MGITSEEDLQQREDEEKAWWLNEHHSKSRTEQKDGGGASKAPLTDSILSSAPTGFYHTPFRSVSATHHRIHNAYSTLSHHGIFSVFTCSQKKKN